MTVNEFKFLSDLKSSNTGRINVESLEPIEKISDDFAEALLDISPYYIGFLSRKLKDDDVLYKKVINEDPWTIGVIMNPSKGLILQAMNLDPEVIEVIQNPNEEVQLMALMHDVDLYQFITNPTEKTKTYYSLKK